MGGMCKDCHTIFLSKLERISLCKRIFLEMMQSSFGEVEIAKKGPKITSKLTNPGISVIYLGCINY